MGPPFKSFLNVSRKQQRRRIRALLQSDINLLCQNNILSNPIRSPFVLSIAHRTPILNVCHEKSVIFQIILSKII